MVETEMVVAVVPQRVPASAADEAILAEDASLILEKADALLIASDEEYELAGAFGTAVKKKITEVKSFFKPMKDNAHQAHKAICDREKAVLTPLEKAEKLVKGAMGCYVMAKEAERRAEEEAMRRAAEMERERQFDIAVALEEQGDVVGAEAAIENAEAMEAAMSYSIPAAEKPKVAGVSYTRAWEIVSVDDAKVPVMLNGAVLRPVDKSAVMALIRSSKGSAIIPGVEYREIVNTRFRGK